MSEIIHEIMLPSKGLPYSKESGIKENITIRAITTSEEKLIYGSGTDNAITKALRACIVEPQGMHLDDITIPDKHFLIVAWRALSYGPEYETSGRCPICGNQNTYVISIQDLVESVKELDQSLMEPYPATLPNSGDEITLRFLRDKDIKEIERFVNLLKRKMTIIDPDSDISYPYRLASYIEAINGKSLSLQEKAQYVEGLTGRDTSYILHIANKMNDYGIDPIVTVSCKTCSSDMRVGVPVDMTFFRSYFPD